MIFKPTFVRRLAVVLTVVNVGGAIFALASGESWHAGVHLSLAVVFALAAQRLREPAESDEQATELDDMQAKLDAQAAQLAELQERVDYAERMLAQTRDRATLGQREKTEREAP